MARAGTKSTQASQGNASRGKKKSSQGSEEESSGAGSYDEDAPPRASQPATKKGKSTASAAASITHAVRVLKIGTRPDIQSESSAVFRIFERR